MKQKVKNPIQVKEYEINGIKGYHHPGTKTAEAMAKDKTAFNRGQERIHNKRYSVLTAMMSKYKGDIAKEIEAAADWHYHQALVHEVKIESFDTSGSKQDRLIRADRLAHEEKYSKMSHNDHKKDIAKHAEKSMIVVMQKGLIRAHSRKTATGKVVRVRAHTDTRTKRKKVIAVKRTITQQKPEPTKVTREAIEIVAKQQGMPLLDMITLLQGGAAKLKDNEKTLEALTAIKNDMIKESKGPVTVAKKDGVGTGYKIPKKPDGKKYSEKITQPKTKKEGLLNSVQKIINQAEKGNAREVNLQAIDLMNDVNPTATDPNMQGKTGAYSTFLTHDNLILGQLGGEIQKIADAAKRGDTKQAVTRAVNLKQYIKDGSYDQSPKGTQKVPTAPIEHVMTLLYGTPQSEITGYSLSVRLKRSEKYKKNASGLIKYLEENESGPAKDKILIQKDKKGNVLIRRKGGESVLPEPKKVATEINQKKVAETIRKQIGQKALTMMGGNFFTYGPGDSGKGALSFKVGKNSKGVTHIKVHYNADDTYTVKYMAIRGTKVTNKGTDSNINVDQFHDSLERNTGMATSLTPRSGGKVVEHDFSAAGVKKKSPKGKAILEHTVSHLPNKVHITTNLDLKGRGITQTGTGKDHARGLKTYHITNVAFEKLQKEHGKSKYVQKSIQSNEEGNTMNLDNFPMMKSILQKADIDTPEQSGSTLQKAFGSHPTLAKAIKFKKTGKEIKAKLVIKETALLEKLNYETGVYAAECKMKHAEKMKEYEGKETDYDEPMMPLNDDKTPYMPYRIREITRELKQCRTVMRNLKDSEVQELDSYELEMYGF